MTAPFPIPQVYEGDGVFRVPRGHVRRCDAQFGVGECVDMAPVEERSSPRHKAFFAAVNEVFKSLPEALTDEHPTADALRQHALIATGWRDQETHVCNSKADAARMASVIRHYIAPDRWPVITVSGCVVAVLVARSQAVKAMSKDDFNASCDAVLKYLAEVIGTLPERIPGEAA